MFCQLCDFIMSSSSDFESFEKFGVCSECSMKFAEQRKDEWASGWRPTDTELYQHKKDISKRVFPILSKIDNYI